MSFNNKLFSVDDYMPQKKKNKSSKNEIFDKRCFGDECFKTEDFFGGFMAGESKGIEPVRSDVDSGLPIPELGKDYNSRFGNIGTGFTEAVDPYQIGFKNILTGDGRTGEIITDAQSAVGSYGIRRKRGRPKGSGKFHAPKSRPYEVETREVTAKKKAGQKVDTKSKTVAEILAGGVKKKLKGHIPYRTTAPVSGEDVGYGTSREYIEEVDKPASIATRRRLRELIAEENAKREDNFAYEVKEGQIRRK